MLRRGLASPEHQQVCPSVAKRENCDVYRMGVFSVRGGGSAPYPGVGAAPTGRPMDIGVTDNAVEKEKKL